MIIQTAEKDREMRAIRIILSLAMGMMLLAFAAAGQAQPQALSGTVSIDLTSVAAGVGTSWGSGVLRYQGRTYRFNVTGLTVGDVGISTISAVGNVYNLYRPSDLGGNYAAVGAGIAIAGGVGGVSMKNQKGVLIQLYSVQQGLQLTIGPQGFNIELR